MNIKIDDLQWNDLTPEMQAYLVDMDLKRRRAEEARPKPANPRAQRVVRNPFAPKPLTRADGSVVYKHPQIPDWDQAYEAHCREQRAKLTKVQR